MDSSKHIKVLTLMTLLVSSAAVCLCYYKRTTRGRVRKFKTRPMNLRRQTEGQFHTLLQSMLNNEVDHEQYFKFMRMTPAMFNYLLELVGPTLQKDRRGGSLSPDHRLAITLHSANAKKWEIELATLKNNNARLTSALQESTANVDEWKRQLASLKEENMRMKAKYQADLENSKGGGELADELRKEIQSLRIRVEQLESELESKNNEIKMHSSSNKVSEIQKENQELQSTIKLAQSELEIALSAHESQKQVLLTLNQQLASRIHELATIHDEMTTALQT